MKYIETEFSKELSDLFTRHKKTITADNSGIYAVDYEFGTKILLGESEVASEDSRPKLIFLVG